MYKLPESEVRPRSGEIQMTQVPLALLRLHATRSQIIRATARELQSTSKMQGRKKMDLVLGVNHRDPRHTESLASPAFLSPLSEEEDELENDMSGHGVAIYCRRACQLVPYNFTFNLKS